MMNYIWGALILISIICGFLCNKSANVSGAILTGAEDAITLLIKLTAVMCLWSGLMKIAEKGGIIRIISKLFSPIMSVLFPKYKNDEKVKGAICSNITANMLGLGNAATPFGVQAMKEMKRLNNTSTADNGMVMFVVINTASIQLIPATIGMLRQTYGAANPFDILPCMLISSGAALLSGVLLAKILEKKR